MALADAMARLMDDMITRQVPWDDLEKLVPTTKYGNNRSNS